MPILARLTLVEGAIHDITLTAAKRTSGRFGRRAGSTSNVGHNSPLRHGVEAVQTHGRGGAVSHAHQKVPLGSGCSGLKSTEAWCKDSPGAVERLHSRTS